MYYVLPFFSVNKDVCENYWLTRSRWLSDISYHNLFVPRRFVYPRSL